MSQVIKHLGGMAPLTMDQNGVSTEGRAQSSTTATTASSKMSKSGNNNTIFRPDLK